MSEKPNELSEIQVRIELIKVLTELLAVLPKESAQFSFIWQTQQWLIGGTINQIKDHEQQT